MDAPTTPRLLAAIDDLWDSAGWDDAPPDECPTCLRALVSLFVTRATLGAELISEEQAGELEGRIAERWEMTRQAQREICELVGTR